MRSRKRASDLIVFEFLSTIFRRKCLIIRPPSRETELQSNAPYLKSLLGWMIDHSMYQGMTRLELGVNPETGKPWMKSFGPHWDDKPTWWELCGPPTESFPVIVQVCLSLAKLGPGVPIHGVIPAVMNGKRLSLELEMHSTNSIRISWDKAISIEREEAGACTHDFRPFVPDDDPPEETH